VKTKFIEGTNKQYSIREDGQVIIHYIRRKNNKIIKYKEIKLLKQDNVKSIVIFVNRIRVKRTSNALLKEYFNTFLCKDCNKYYKKTTHAVLCNTCYNKRRKLSKAKTYINTKEFQLKKSFYKTLFLDNNVVSTRLGLPINMIPKELLELKRQQMLLNRKLKSLKQ
jgi:Zn finger protein HypA/HybF involved in hydrogenase expression